MRKKDKYLKLWMNTKGFTWKQKIRAAWYCLTAQTFELKTVRLVDIYQEQINPKLKIFYRIK